MAIKFNGQIMPYAEASVLDFRQNRPVCSFLKNDRWGVACKEEGGVKKYSLTEHEELLSDTWHTYDEFVAFIQNFITEDAVKAAEDEGEFIPQDKISINGDTYSFTNSAGELCEYKAGRGDGYDFSAWKTASGKDLKIALVAAEIDTDLWKHLGVVIKSN